MEYKLKFIYDNKEHKAMFFYGRLAVCRRYVYTYEDLAKFTSEMISKYTIIPGMKKENKQWN